MHSPWRIRRWAVGAAMAWVAPWTWAQTANPYCSRPLHLALFEYGVLYRSATHDGVDARLADVLFQRTGCAIDTVVMPRARMWNEMQAGRLDLITGAVVTQERLAYSFLLPYVKSRNMVVLRHRPGAQGPPTQTEFDATDGRIGVLRSGHYQPSYDAWVERLRGQGRIVEASDAQEQTRLLQRGVVAGIISPPIVFPLYLDAAWLEREADVLDWAPQDPPTVGALMLSRKTFTPAQAQHWDQLLVALAQDGTLYRMYRQFMPPAQARDMVYSGARTPDPAP